MNYQEASHYIAQCNSISNVAISIREKVKMLSRSELTTQERTTINHVILPRYYKIHKMLQRGLSYMRGDMKVHRHDMFVLSSKQHDVDFFYRILWGCRNYRNADNDKNVHVIND